MKFNVKVPPAPACDRCRLPVYDLQGNFYEAAEGGSIHIYAYGFDGNDGGPPAHHVQIHSRRAVAGDAGGYRRHVCRAPASPPSPDGWRPCGAPGCSYHDCIECDGEGRI